MTRLLAVFALATSLCVAFAQDDTSTTDTTSTTVSTPGATVMIGPFMTTHNLGWEDAAAAIAIAQAIGMEPDIVVTSRPTTVTTSYYDLAPAYVIAHESGQPVGAIIDLYNNGQTWVQIANKYNVQASVWNPDNVDTTNWTNEDFSNAMWRHILMTNYGMNAEDYGYFQTQHVPWNEVVVAQVYGRETNHPIRDVWTTYSTGGNQWTTVRTTYAQVIPPTTTVTTQTTTTQERTRVVTPPPVTTTQSSSTYVSSSSRPITTTKSKTSRTYTVARRTTRHYTRHYSRHTSVRALRFAKTAKRHTTHRHTTHHRCCCCCK